MNSNRPDRRSQIAAALIAAPILVFALWLYWNSHLKWPLLLAYHKGDSRFALQQFGGILSGNDFPHIYFGSLALWRGENPYLPDVLIPMVEQAIGRSPLPYVYLPFTGLAMGPLLLLDHWDAFLVWFLAGHLMAWLTAAVSIAALRAGWNWRVVVFSAVVLAISAPLFRSQSAGQLNMPLALAYALFWWALVRKRNWLAGLVGAVAALFKLSPGILIVYLLWTRRWRAAGWLAGWGALLMAISVAWAGLDVHLAFVPMLADMGYGRSTWPALHHFYCDPANQSFNALLHHLFALTPATVAPLADFGPAAANAFTWIVSLLLLGGVLTLTWPNKKNSNGGLQEPLGYSLFLFLSLLLPSLCWDHYFIQLLFPMIVIFLALSRRMNFAIGVLFLAGLLAISMDYNFWDERWRQGAGLLLMSPKLYGALALFAANILLIRQTREKADAGDLA